MKVLLLLLSLYCLFVSGRYVAPAVKALFVETFQSETTHPSINWVQSRNEKYTGRFVVDEPPKGKRNVFPGDKGLIASESHRYYGLSRKLGQPIDPNAGKSFVIQYEFRPVEIWDCAGGYLKFFSDPNFSPSDFSEADSYNIMFGPDRCGGDAKVHFIIQRPGPSTGKLVEHHLTSPPEPMLDYNTHLYQLVVDINAQTFEIFVDMESKRSGSFAADFFPPLEPPKEIADPDDRQPDNWVTQEKIPDPNAVKPSDWDETVAEFIDDPEAARPEDWDENAPEYIKDPNGVKPEDWNDEEDGEWMHPMIPNPVCASSGCGKWLPPRIRNPAYKGKWVRPIIDNPNYKGKWEPRRIPNPNYKSVGRLTDALRPITAIGVEWWTVQAGPMIDNIVIGRSKKALDLFSNSSSMLKVLAEKEAYLKLVNGQQPEESKELQPWKFIAVGAFVVGAVVLMVLLCCCCSGSKAAAKPKKE